MTLEELVAEVISITSRPDLQERTTQAVRAATQKLHQADFWRRDLAEVPVQFDVAQYIHSFDVYEFIPKFRSVKYVRKPAAGFYDFIEPEEVVNSYGNMKSNVAYLAGRILHLRSSEPFTTFLFGYYTYPDLTAENWDSWISEEFPWAIIYDAASTMLTGIGYQELAAGYLNQAREQFKIMQRTAINPEGN